MRPLAARLAAADVAIVSGGQTLNEALALGTPALVTMTAANQLRQIRAAARAGACVSLGRLDSPRSNDRLSRELDRIADLRLRKTLSGVARRLVDGRGAIRVAEALDSLAASG